MQKRERSSNTERERAGKLRVVYLGIDPGKSGGLAVLDERGRVELTEPMPETEADLLDLLATIKSEYANLQRTMVERASARPTDGAVQAFTFGRGIGALHMALQACRISFDLVVPKVWQTAMGCLSKGDKNVTKRRAQQLFPIDGLTITHATADALLIAEYGRRFDRGVYGKKEGRQEERQIVPVSDGGRVATRGLA